MDIYWDNQETSCIDQDTTEDLTIKNVAVWQSSQRRKKDFISEYDGLVSEMDDDWGFHQRI